MTTPRWDIPWVNPVGSAPERPAGEPGPSLLAVVHLAVLFALSAVGGALTGIAGRSEGGASVCALIVAVAAGAVGWVALSRHTPLMAWIADLLLAISSSYLFGAVALLAHAQGSSEAQASLIGALVALPYAAGLYLAHRRIWLQLATVGAAAGALLASLATRSEVPTGVYGAFLLLLAGFVAVGAVSEVLTPVPSAFVLSALLATAGAQVLISADTFTGSVVALLVLGLVGYGVVRSKNRSLLPVALVAGVLLLPQLLAPAVGQGRAIGLSMAGVGAVVAWIAVDLSRRSVRPPQIGGVFLACTLLVLASNALTLTVTVGDASRLDAGDVVYVLLQAAAVTAFFGAAAAARRRVATVLSGLLVLGAVPAALAAPFGGGSGMRAFFSLLALGGAVYAAAQLDRRAPRPAASPYQQEISLSGGGREWTVVAPYGEVFDAVVGVLGAAGVALQLVDRAAGRVVAGDPVKPLLVVAVWASDPVRARVRAVGAAWDVDRLEADVAARFGNGVAAARFGNGVAPPH